MKEFDEYLAMVNQAIANLRLPERPAGLYDPIRYTLDCGGKRLRPVLALAACHAMGKEPISAVHQAIAIEMFHNFTLLHDDVMDNSDMRRGRPSVHARWDVNTAILSGDTMLTLATMQVARVDGSILREVLDSFNDMAVKVYEGQRLDMDFETSDTVSLDDYLHMISLKTGILLGTSARIGALIGGASKEDADRMTEYGVCLLYTSPSPRDGATSRMPSSA